MRSASSAMANADRVAVPLTRTFCSRLLMPAVSARSRGRSLGHEREPDVVVGQVAKGRRLDLAGRDRAQTIQILAVPREGPYGFRAPIGEREAFDGLPAEDALGFERRDRSLQFLAGDAIFPDATDLS